MTDRLTPGDTAPDFTLTSDTGEQVTLSHLRGRKVIVYFYPAAMTLGCTKQACDFTDSLDPLRGAGYEVLGISPDKPEKLAKFRERDALTLTLLSDPGKEVMQAWGAFGEKKLSTARSSRASSARPWSSTRRAGSRSRSTTSRPPATWPRSARTSASPPDRAPRSTASRAGRPT